MASVAALLAGAAWLELARRQRAIAADLEFWWRGLERHSSRAIGVAALIAALVAAIFATRSAAGADASGYLSQAEMWSTGQVRYVDPLATVISTAEPWLTAPLGWRPAGAAGLQSPTYAPGLPLLMAVPHAIAGIGGAHALVVAGAAIAVWATGMIAGGIAGLIASVLLAFTPVFVYQSIQPMSDVPVTAAWMLCFLVLCQDKPSLRSSSDEPLGLSIRAASGMAGVMAALAVLIRPNLAPLAIVPLALARRRIAFAVPVAVAGAFLAFMQWLWYGSPLRSGYGSAGELFALANAGPNAARYLGWLVATAPIMLFSLFGFWRMRRDRTARALAAFAALVVASYLVYAVFDQWSYLRFLLPAMAVLAVFAGVDLAAWIERWPVPARGPFLAAVLLMVSAHGVWVARELDSFRLRDQLRRVGQVADAINRTVPPSAVIVSGEQSGAMRYFTFRSILRWDVAAPALLAPAIETLQRSGREVYIALDAWEEEPFRRKFAAVPAIALDWPPMLEAGTSHRTKLWRAGDRERFLRGERVETTRVP